MKRQKSLLFVLPDYHSSFALRDALRALGWRSEILVPDSYPERFLFANDVVRPWHLSLGKSKFVNAINVLLAFIHYLTLAFRFKYHIHYGRMFFPPTIEHLLTTRFSLPPEFHLAHALTRKLGVRHVHLPSGCRDEATKRIFSQVENGRVCNNCGFFDACVDRDNQLYLSRANRYSEFSVASGFFESTELRTVALRTKCLYPGRWSPGNRSEHRIRVLHSHALESRSLLDRNIKGTPIINDVMKKVCDRHDHVEYRLVTGLTSREMLEEQIQAHIVIDQLHYGHWGSSGVEAMGTGAVVVAYLRAEWIDNFKSKFPQYSKAIPVVAATPETLESVIEELVTNAELRLRLSSESVNFAQTFYSPISVAEELVCVLAALK